MSHHTELEVWKKSIEFVTDIYELTKTFPQDELYALTNQIRRSVISIPSNIAEGCARYSDIDTKKFLYIALGSVAETETQLIISQNLGYVKNIDIYMQKLHDINKMLIGLIKYVSTKNE